MFIVLLAACQSRQEDSSFSPPGASNVPPLELGEHRVELEARGVGIERLLPFLYLLPPDDGEDCVTSWLSPDLAPGTAAGSADSVPLPANPVTGTTWSFPPAPTSGPHFPPLFEIDNQPFAWSGGQWEIVAWTEAHFEIHLFDGETCAFDGLPIVPGTCVPDEGTVTWEPLESDRLLAVEDKGYRGTGSRYPDPAGNGFLCEEITYEPPPPNSEVD